MTSDKPLENLVVIQNACKLKCVEIVFHLVSPQAGRTKQSSHASMTSFQDTSSSGLKTHVESMSTGCKYNLHHYMAEYSVLFSSSVIGLMVEAHLSFSPTYTERRAKKKKKNYFSCVKYFYLSQFNMQRCNFFLHKTKPNAVVLRKTVQKKIILKIK